MPIVPKAKLERIEIGLDEPFDLDYTHEVLDADKISVYNEEAGEYVPRLILLVLRRGL